MENALLCLNASAGSGKTYRLVSRYLELLFLGAKPSEILTLTFTKKAAKEMEERIVKGIWEIYQRKNDREYIKKLEFLNIKDDSELMGAIEEKITQVYHNFLKEDLKITTIDSFFQRILKNFCWYVGVENDFDIQNENLEVITEIFLESLNEEIFNKIVAFCAQKRTNIKSILSLCFLLDSFKEMLDKNLFIYKSPKGYKTQAMEYAYRLQQTYKNAKGEASGVMDFSDFDLLLQRGKTWLTKEVLQEYRGFKSIPFNKEDFRGLKESVLKVFLEEESQYLGELYEIFEIYLKAKEEYYKQSNTLSFNAVTSKVYELLLKQSFDKDFLYFRLDSAISHILIDEFQDTSILQYEILKPMIDEVKSGKGAKEFLRSFFYVGDIKQSIYRFRGGNPNLFRIAAEGMKQENLQKNYRSAKNLVEFVNEVFSNKIDGFVPQIANSKNDGFLRVFKSEAVESAYIGVAQCLRELLDLGAKQEEIAILLFDNDSVVELAEFLQAEGFRVVMDTSAKLVFHNEVRALIQSLKYFISKNPQFCEEFFMLLGLEKESLEPYFGFVESPPAEVLLKVMQHFKIASLSAKKFLEYALGFSSIEELLEKVESLQADIVSSEFFGIRIMTIHKSKGLEFNHVLIIDNNKAKNRYNSVFFEFRENGVEIQRVFQKMSSHKSDVRKSLDKAYMEALLKEEILREKDLKNQLYVALTRAKSTMQIMLLAKNEKGESKGSFDALGLKDLQKGDLKKALEEINLEADLKSNSLKKQEKAFYWEAKSKMSLEFLGIQKQMQIAQKKMEEGKIEGIYYGVALHFVMEQKIKNKLDDSVILEILCNKMGFLIDKESLQNIIKHCKNILKNSRFIEIMAKGKVKCEIPFLSNGRQKRLDLLIIGEKEAFIVDYKSGKQRESYATQVLEYMRSVREILQKPTYGFIFYAEGEGRLVEVIGE